MTNSNYIVSSKSPLTTEQKSKGGRNNIVVGMVVKAKIVELEDYVRAGSSRRMLKEMNGLVQGISEISETSGSFSSWIFSTITTAG